MIKIEISADFVVDARGRFTPFKDEYISGPKVFLFFKSQRDGQFFTKQNFADSTQDVGFGKLMGNKKGYIQFTCDEELAKNINDFDEIVRNIKRTKSRFLESLQNAKAVGKIVKRDSYSKILKRQLAQK